MKFMAELYYLSLRRVPRSNALWRRHGERWEKSGRARKRENGAIGGRCNLIAVPESRFAGQWDSGPEQ